MKQTISTLHDALAYQIAGLLYAETTVKEEFKTCSTQITSEEVKAAIQQYIDSAHDKLQKIDRTFSYLMQKPKPRKNKVIDSMLAETHELLNGAPPGHLKDVLMVGCIQNINTYKKETYKTAYLFAVELDLENVADLIQQILNWEYETARSLATLSIQEFNKVNGSIKMH